MNLNYDSRDRVLYTNYTFELSPPVDLVLVCYQSVKTSGKITLASILPLLLRSSLQCAYSDVKAKDIY